LINTRTANARDMKRTFQMAEAKVRYRLPRTKCPNCEHRQVFNHYQDQSRWCYNCGWDSNKVELEPQPQPKVVRDMRPRLVKKGS
jgi:uncharacterized protein (DUF983 family)